MAAPKKKPTPKKPTPPKKTIHTLDTLDGRLQSLEDAVGDLQDHQRALAKAVAHPPPAVPSTDVVSGWTNHHRDGGITETVVLRDGRTFQRFLGARARTKPGPWTEHHLPLDLP